MRSSQMGSPLSGRQGWPWLSAFLTSLAIAGFPSPRSRAAGQDVNPCPPALVVKEKLREWSFESGPDGWVAQHHCAIHAKDGVLEIAADGTDPYLAAPAAIACRNLVVKLRARLATEGMGQLFWVTDRHPQTSEAHSKHFQLSHDGKWHEYTVPIEVDGSLSFLRLDPGSGKGKVEIDWIAIHEGGAHPLTIEKVEAAPPSLTLHVKNLGKEPVDFSFQGKDWRVEAGQTLPVSRDMEGSAPFEVVRWKVEPRNMPPLERTVVFFRPEARADFLELRSAALEVLVARDGSGARIERKGKLIAALAPLVLAEAGLPALRLAASSPEAAEFHGEGIQIRLQIEGDEIAVSIRSEKGIEGPVLRALGSLEGGLFAGLEYLGKGERSSSKLDIETEDHLRFAPDPIKVTMPLMSCVTENGAAAVTWKDMSLGPVFATPNFLDGTPDHRMALRGKDIEARILLRETSLEETILWAVERFGGLPPVPEPPRSATEQLDLCLKAFQGPIAGEGGWGHCAEPSYPRRWHADMASGIWRIAGEVPRIGGALIPGGAHVRNDAIYFVTGNAPRWLDLIRSEKRGLISSQLPDGSWTYAGPYRRGHFEDTASGICARPASRLLEIALFTGDEDALAAGRKALEHMKRFSVPRGAQTWELSLHTPDVLASAYLVWAYARGHELTGKKEYLEQARRWALTGVPFVYLWGKHPVMLYATPPVYGATNYRAPLWIGLPVQWCGLVYAYSLTLLAPHDKTLDWSHLARGILVAGQQMQYPDGPLMGCLPDVFSLPAQARGGPSINPGGILSLDLVLGGRLDSLAVATGGGRRIVAPFPVRIQGSEAHVDAREGVKYQVLVDGQKIIDVKSRGKDVLILE